MTGILIDTMHIRCPRWLTYAIFAGIFHTGVCSAQHEALSGYKIYVQSDEDKTLVDMGICSQVTPTRTEVRFTARMKAFLFRWAPGLEELKALLTARNCIAKY